MRTPTMPGKIPDSEYSAILQQAVEIIKTARVRISKQLNILSYHPTGKLASCCPNVNLKANTETVWFVACRLT